MKAIIDKWNELRSQKKLKNLWNEYKKVTISTFKLNRNPEIQVSKLNSFLSLFNKLAQEYSSKNSNLSSLNKLFSNITELFELLIKEISKYFY